MSLPRLRLEGCLFDGEVWHVGAEEAHHLIRVRRCYTGSLVEGLLRGEKIELRLECGGGEVTARELSRCGEAKIIPRVELLLGLLNNDQLDDALRFCAETCAAEIHLLVCERSVPRYGGARLVEKMTRWRRILDEATKQAGAATPPLLREPRDFEKFDFGALPKQRLAAMLSPDSKPLRLIEIEESAALEIGPEGDWSPREGAELIGNGFVPVTLGKRIMRASTAVAAGCAALQMLHGQRRR